MKRKRPLRCNTEMHTPIRQELTHVRCTHTHTPTSPPRWRPPQAVRAAPLEVVPADGLGKERLMAAQQLEVGAGAARGQLGGQLKGGGGS